MSSENQSEQQVVYVGGDDVDAFWSQQYWAGRARHYEAVEAARREMFAMKGQQVVVVKGRKVPVGTTGECFWVGEGKYGARVGFKDAEGEVFWTAYANVATVAEVEAEKVSA